MPAISIVMPVYNNKKYLAEAIESVRRQSFTDWELIIIDDHSEENVWEILCQYTISTGELYDPRIRCFRNSLNLGLIDNTNECIWIAAGKYIKFLDSDDALLPGALHSLFYTLEKYPGLSIASGGVVTIDPEGREVNGIDFPMRWDKEGVATIKDCVQHGNRIGPPSAIMVRKRDKPKMYAGYQHLCDLVMELDLLEKGGICSVGGPVVKYRVHPEQSSHKKQQKPFAEDHARLYHEFKCYLDTTERLVAMKNAILVVPVYWRKKRMYSFTRMLWETIKQVRRVVFA